MHTFRVQALCSCMGSSLLVVQIIRTPGMSETIIHMLSAIKFYWFSFFIFSVSHPIPGTRCTWIHAHCANSHSFHYYYYYLRWSELEKRCAISQMMLSVYSQINLNVRTASALLNICYLLLIDLWPSAVCADALEYAILIQLCSVLLTIDCDCECDLWLVSMYRKHHDNIHNARTTSSSLK